MIDLAATTSQARLEDPPPTCHVHANSTGSRIDLALANRVLASSCRGCSLLEDSALPVHTPLLASFETASVAQQGPCFQTPLAIPLNFGDSDPDAERYQSSACAQECVQSHAHDFNQALHSKDVEKAFLHFNGASEKYLCTRAFGQPYVKPYCGRGRVKMRSKTTAAPFRDSETHCAVSSKCWRLQKLTRRLEEMARKLQLRAHAMTPIPQEWWNLWRTTCQDGASLAPHMRAWNDVTNIPDLPTLLAMISEVKNLAKQQRLLETARRVESRAELFRDDWNSKRKLSHAFCRGEKPPMPPLMCREDGTWTGDRAEMDGMLRDAWLPVFRL